MQSADQTADSAARRVITLTTDFGGGSPYVAQMKGVILGINPGAVLVDATHDVPPQDIAAGALVLRDLLPAFPPGSLHVAVIDPGVGTARRIITAEIDGRRVIGPDNGLWSWCRGEVRDLYEVAQPRFWRHPVSATFHGRDIMAPVAAQLSLGVLASDLGPPGGEMLRLACPAPVLEAGSIAGQVLAIDAFGNAITNIDAATWRGVIENDAGAIITAAGQELHGLSRTYGESQHGTLIALFGSSGLLEIAEVGGDGARRLGLARGGEVRVRRS